MGSLLLPGQQGWRSGEAARREANGGVVGAGLLPQMMVNLHNYLHCGGTGGPLCFGTALRGTSKLVTVTPRLWNTPAPSQRRLVLYPDSGLR
jgi:hypothetical protein